MARSVTCTECQHSFETTSPPGRSVPCKSCEKPVRVPLRAAALEERTIECPGCRASFRTSLGPGKKATCKGCGEKVRIPLPDAEEVEEKIVERILAKDEAAEAALQREGPRVRRECPACGERVIDAGDGRCSVCDADMDDEAMRQRYGGRSASGRQGWADGVADQSAGFNAGLGGGIVLIVIGVVTALIGLSQGWIMLLPLILIVGGLGSVSRALYVKNRRRR